MYTRILAGTDLSKTARVATDRAAALASKLGARFVLLHAGSAGQGLSELAALYGAETIVEDGNAAEVLVSKPTDPDADLLVVGSVGMSGARRFLLGSVPNKVSHHASTDLLIVKTDPPPPHAGLYATAVVGTDGSPTARKAVDRACELASTLGLALTIACAYEPPTERERDELRADPNDPVAQWNVSPDARGVPDEFRWRIAAADQADDVLDRAMDQASRWGVDARPQALEGNPAEVLVSMVAVHAYDLVVVGSVGMRGAKRFMLGNVPHRISHHARTDVLIVKTA